MVSGTSKFLLAGTALPNNRIHPSKRRSHQLERSGHAAEATVHGVPFGFTCERCTGTARRSRIALRYCVRTIASGIDLPGTELAEMCRRYQIKELSLFGSAVRGEMRPDSDIDLLVEFMPDAEVSLFGHFDAEQELSKLVGKKVDLVSKTALRGRLRNEILAEARSIYAA